MTSDRDTTSRSEEERERDDTRDEIYPSSSPDARSDAEIQSGANVVGYGRSPRRHPNDERDSKKNQSWGSE